MKYTIMKDDVSMTADSKTSIIESAVVLVVLVFFFMLKKVGHAGLALLGVTGMLCYGLLVAYVKMMFCSLGEGSVITLMKSSVGYIVSTESASMWLPIRVVMCNNEQGLDVYTLTLKIPKEVDTLDSEEDK